MWSSRNFFFASSGKRSRPEKEEIKVDSKRISTWRQRQLFKNFTWQLVEHLFDCIAALLEGEILVEVKSDQFGFGVFGEDSFEAGGLEKIFCLFFCCVLNSLPMMFGSKMPCCCFWKLFGRDSKTW
jgi:hypothetical protein